MAEANDLTVGRVISQERKFKEISKINKQLLTVFLICYQNIHMKNTIHILQTEVKVHINGF